MPTWKIFNADCREAMASLPASSVDAVVTDPPYGLGFMGKDWDHEVPGVEFWRAAFRVLKPGGHLAAFGGTRKVHRLTCAIEDAGFEVRDLLMWMYGSGFPKSLDISKAVNSQDRIAERRRRSLVFTEWMRSTGITSDTINAATKSAMASHYLTDKEQPEVATEEMFAKLRPLLPPVPPEIEALVRERTVESENMKARKVIGKHKSSTAAAVMRVNLGGGGRVLPPAAITAPLTEEAQKWEGWGTALKPAWEPIILARKPFKGTVGANVIRHGTGALNVDGCRVGASGGGTECSHWPEPCRGHGPEVSLSGPTRHGSPPPGWPNAASGRWPANVVLTHAAGCREIGTKRVKSSNFEGGGPRVNSIFAPDPREREGAGYADAEGMETVEAWECVPDCPVRLLDEQSGETESPETVTRGISSSPSSFNPQTDPDRAKFKDLPCYGDKGGASRFFYTAKASTAEREEGLAHLPKKSGGALTDREEGSTGLNSPRAGAGRKSERANTHPTVKPVSLMAWLIKLLTPEGGIVLDPFCGSGSTGVAAVMGGWSFVGVEIDPEHARTSRARVRSSSPLFAREGDPCAQVRPGGVPKKEDTPSEVSTREARDAGGGPVPSPSSGE